MAQLEAAENKPEEEVKKIPPLKLRVKPGPSDGSAKVQFNHKMIIPLDHTTVDYSSLFDLTMKSSQDYTSTKGKFILGGSKIAEEKRKQKEKEKTEGKPEEKPEKTEKPEDRSLAEEDDIWEVKEEKIEIKFDWWVEYHTPKEIKIQMEYEQPDLVSTVGQDSLIIKIPDMSKFVSSETGKEMDESAVLDGKSAVRVRMPSIVNADTAK